MKAVFMVFLSFMALAIASIGVSESVWEDVTGGINDSEFLTIAVDTGTGKNVYLGTNIALYRMKNAEGIWEKIFLSSGEFKGVNYICPSGSRIYIATGNGAYRSDDSGANWERIYSGLGQQQNRVTRILPGKNGIYVGTLKGLFWSANGTHAWQKPDGILGRARITSFALTSTGENMFVVADNEVYKIDSQLKNYTKVFGNDEIIFTDEDDLDLESLDEEGPSCFLTDIKVCNDSIYLSTTKGLFVSADDG
ncbi:MAG: hypothetical protein ABIH57_03035, partial [Candidatus Omnitrophota bacterium]